VAGVSIRSQDLILSRLMVEIASNEFLGGELVMRGGTCLHKLHFPKPYRYSEDLDYVRRTAGPIGPYLDQLREVADDIGLSVSQVDRARTMVHMILDAEATDPHAAPWASLTTPASVVRQHQMVW
jgi:predicted nucleotidyltransferase component of viral defense system